MSRIIEASEQMEVSAPARELVDGMQDVRVAVQALLDAELDQDALMLTARLLPKRYAVAWVCQCAREETLDMEARAGLALAEAWAREPTEDNRRAGLEFANAGRYRTLGAWFAAMVGWSGGSLAPATQETPVPPSEDLTARAVAAAINLMAMLDENAFAERRRAYMQRALSLLGDDHGGPESKRED